MEEPLKSKPYSSDQTRGIHSVLKVRKGFLGKTRVLAEGEMDVTKTHCVHVRNCQRINKFNTVGINSTCHGAVIEAFQTAGAVLPAAVKSPLLPL